MTSPTDIPSPTFSTLEYDHNANDKHPPAHGLIAVTSEDEALPEVVQSHSGDHQKLENEITVGHNDEAPTSATRFTRRRLGYIIMGISLVALAVVLGSVFGIRDRGSKTSSVRPSDDNATTITAPSPTGIPEVRISPMSNITATFVPWKNRTDPTTCRFVVFQDITGALISRGWNSTANTWSTRNLTGIASDSSPLNEMEGTPLASVALYYGPLWWLKLWGLHPDGSIFAISWPLRLLFEEDLKNQLGTMIVSTIPKVLLSCDNRTSLAAFSGSVFKTPGENSEPAYLMYQSYDGFVGTTKWNTGSGPQKISPILAKEYVSLQSHLDIFRPLEELNNGTNRTLLLSYESNGRWVQNHIDLPDFNHVTNYPTEIENLAENSYNSQRDVRQLITMPFIYNSTHGNVYFMLLSNGTLLGKRNLDHQMRQITVSEEPTPNFTSIATTDDARLYGIAGDQILEYSFNADLNASKNFSYVGRVYP